MSEEVRNIEVGDAPRVAEIYNYYISNTRITFEEQPLSPEEMLARIVEVTKEFPWLVYVKDGVILGYAYGSKWKARCAYRYSSETSVYIEKDHRGLGIGGALYVRLIEELKKKGLKTIIGGVALPNQGSQRLHEKLGFKKVAHFEKVGFKMNQWIDVGYWELRVE